MDDQEARDELLTELKAVCMRFIKQAMTPEIQRSLESSVMQVLTAFAQRHPFPINTGVTAADCRDNHSIMGMVPDHVPDEWEMWCDGWDAKVQPNTAHAQMNIHFAPIRPQFRPPAVR